MAEIKDIENKLRELGENPKLLDDVIQKYLQPIEDIIQREYERQAKAIQELKSSGFSLLSISSELECSRTTLYNHKAVKKYIESANEEMDSRNPFSIIEELKVQKNRMQVQINKMVSRDIDTENIKAENEKLKAENKALAEDNKRLIEMINKSHKL